MKLKIQMRDKKGLKVIGKLLGIAKYPKESYEEFRERLLVQHTKNIHEQIFEGEKSEIKGFLDITGNKSVFGTAIENSKKNKDGSHSVKVKMNG